MRLLCDFDRARQFHDMRNGSFTATRRRNAQNPRAAIEAVADPSLRNNIQMKPRRIALAAAVIMLVAIMLVAIALVAIGVHSEEAEKTAAAPRPVLSVVMTRARMSTLPIRIPATGDIVAWQEASVGTEADGLRLIDVRVNVGDKVRRGQVLASFNADIVAAELAEARAAVAQAGAQVVEAEANARRAKELDDSGAMSSQQIDQYVVAAMTARARLDAARAIEKKNRLRLAQTRVLAPSDGIITSRAATVGAVVPAGQELFRLIEDGRLEWRAAVATSEMDRLAPGQNAIVAVHGRAPIRGTVRIVGPSIDTQTRNGLVYVDLPRDIAMQAGAFARGYLEAGEGTALTLPQTAVLLRDGFTYVMRVGPASKVMMKKVTVGRRTGDRIEITAGLDASEAVVASGLGFLSEGDNVRIVSAAEDGKAQRRTAHGSAASGTAPLARGEP